MKEPSTDVLVAQEKIKHWESEIQYLCEQTNAARESLAAARLELQQAYEAEDDKFFSVVQSIRRSRYGNDHRVEKVVILRQTPSGRLVCRKYGHPESEAVQYKLSFDGNEFRQLVSSKSAYSSYGISQLEGVPQEYIDRARAASKR